MENYGLDMHCSIILDEFRELLPTYRALDKVVRQQLDRMVKENGIYVTAMESRVKAEKSLAGKLELKGHKYNSVKDLTDMVGARIITFYEDEVDKIAALVGKTFDVDWNDSVDKRKMHQLDSFGYGSLHYICRVPESMYYDPEFPHLNEIRFEIQMRTALQHVWATFDHDTGYKSGVQVPAEYIRRINRLAGVLELADEQIGLLRTEINDYRRRVQALLDDGCYDEVILDIQSFRKYLTLNPFDNLNKKIAAINQAEILETSLIPYLPVLQDMGYKTLGDLDNLISTCSDDAYQFAVFEIGNTDLDIISSTVGLQDLIIVDIMKKGLGKDGLVKMFNILNGENNYNITRADSILEHAAKLEFMNKKK